MKIDCITKVKLHKLNDKKYDRRGTIITFFVYKVPNMKYMMNKALSFLWTLTSLLDDGYSADRWIESMKNFGQYFSEGNECWIAPDYDENKIYVRHKYWTDNQVECFKNMVLALAKLNEWEWEIEQ